LVHEADGQVGMPLGSSGRSPKADVGFTRCTAQFPELTHYTAEFPELTRPKCVVGGWSTGCRPNELFAGANPWAEEGMVLLEKAAGQGHAYAMLVLGDIHRARKELERAVEWYTKGAEAGLPRAMSNLGCRLDRGEGVAAPDYPAAAGWYRLAAEAGVGVAAYNLSGMYALGRGTAWQIMLASSSSTF